MSDREQRRPAEYLEKIVIDGTNDAKFCILLGAGASITSGIPGAGRLVSEWKRELCKLKLSDGTLASDNEFENWFERWKVEESGLRHGVSDYAVLIEHFYPTSSLRQGFIENEINGKYPGVGYLYLSMLMESGLFNVVFTTNFDDLVNDALYRFVDMRPLVCSFDSSVKSIRITSPRPKIIKLHGDYLFDDIMKNTSSEVRSLSVNMQMKFKQFCQEYGLIVIGYGGHDGSIMDIIDGMLKDPDYLKMGLHWCLLESDPIPPRLEPLIGISDRLHFYRVDSFDIVMSQLVRRAGLELPIELTNPRKSKTITALTDCIKVQATKHLSDRTLEDNLKILKALQTADVDAGVRIKEANGEVKRIQRFRDNGDLQRSLDCVEEGMRICDEILDDPDMRITSAERCETTVIKATALIGKSKAFEKKGKKAEDVITPLQQARDLLEAEEAGCAGLRNSRIPGERFLFCRLHYNAACILGLLSSYNPRTRKANCKAALKHIEELKGIREGTDLVDKARNGMEADLQPFCELPEWKRFWESF